MGRMKPKRRFPDGFGLRKKNETIIILVVSGQWSVVSGQWSVERISNDREAELFISYF